MAEAFPGLEKAQARIAAFVESDSVRHYAKLAVEAAEEERLDLYELDRKDRIGYIDRRGEVYLPDRHPKILFAAVPVNLHLSNGVMVAPFDSSSDQTGPGPHGIDAPLD